MVTTALRVFDMRSKQQLHPSMWDAADAMFEEVASAVFPQEFPAYYAGHDDPKKRTAELLGMLRSIWDGCLAKRDLDPALDDAVEDAILGGVGTYGVDHDEVGFGLILVDGYAFPSESLSIAERDSLFLERLYRTDFDRARKMRALSRCLERRGHSKTINAEMAEWEKSHPERCTGGETRVYFIRNGHGNLKIGITNDLAKRLKQLSSATGVDSEFTLLGSVVYPSRQAATAREVELHKRFSSCRAKGEWFRPTDELVAFINEELAEAAKAN